jgi:hypothetical protein
MDALRLIDNYNEAYTGKSHFIDQALTQVKRALQDASRNAEKSDFAFAEANMFLARNTAVKLLEAITHPDTIRKIIIDIYMSIEDEISTNQEGGK